MQLSFIQIQTHIAAKYSGVTYGILRGLYTKNYNLIKYNRPLKYRIFR